MENEQRLIDANVVVAQAKEEMYAYEAEKFADWISKFPTVNTVEVVLCGQCKSSDISVSIPCAYICCNEKAPCYKRATCADFGCLYGEKRECEQ